MSKAYPKIIVTIDTQNAAFGDTTEEKLAEVIRIVEGGAFGCRVAEALEDGSAGPLKDSNGNTCGTVRAK